MLPNLSVDALRFLNQSLKVTGLLRKNVGDGFGGFWFGHGWGVSHWIGTPKSRP
jgi:hypothetical protein